MLDNAIYCREFDKTPRAAGRASFQLSPEKTALVREKNRDVAGIEGGAALETSYNAIVREMASLTNSFRKTAVEVR